jgi:hypothetical protein
MSWRCTEGPYGRYPGEDGYDDDLTRYAVEQIENKLRYDDSVEQRVISHVREAAKSGKLSWVQTTQNLVGSMGTYLTQRVFKRSHVIKIDKSAGLVKRRGKNNIYNLYNQHTSLEISKESSHGFRVPILDLKIDAEDAEDLVDRIKSKSGYLIVFASSAPTKNQAASYSVLTI